MATQIGFSQTSKPAPLGYRRFVNAYAIAFVPAVTSLIMSLPLSANVDKYIFAGLGFLTAIIKGIGIVLGNGQSYVPSNEAVDSKAAAPVVDIQKPAP